MEGPNWGTVMDPAELTELHYITPIENLGSIMQHGILSHKLASSLQPASIANGTVQQMRKQKVVPGGRPLHDYVNLYFCARNPMMFKRKAQHASLCVLSVSPEVLHLDGVILTDGNAASVYTRFAPSPTGLSIVNTELVFAEYWTQGDEIERYKRKSAKCAEVLVPEQVGSLHIVGAYVSCSPTQDQLEAMGIQINISVKCDLFFQ